MYSVVRVHRTFSPLRCQLEVVRRWRRRLSEVARAEGAYGGRDEPAPGEGRQGRLMRSRRIELLLSVRLCRTPSMPSTNRIEQQDTERRHVEAFLRALNLEPAVEPGDQPDFVLVFEGQNVGLEHSELYDEGLQKNRAQAKRFERFLSEEMRT